jgi:hypothetical protein
LRLADWVTCFSNCKESNNTKGGEVLWNSREGVVYFVKKNIKIKEVSNEKVKNVYFYFVGDSATGYFTSECFFSGKADRT